MYHINKALSIEIPPAWGGIFSAVSNIAVIDLFCIFGIIMYQFLILGNVDTQAMAKKIAETGMYQFLILGNVVETKPRIRYRPVSIPNIR